MPQNLVDYNLYTEPH